MSDFNDFLMGGAKSISFEEYDDTVVGVIVEPQPELVQMTDFKTGDPLFWDKEETRPKMQLVINLLTQERDEDDPSDDGRRRLYVKGNMRKAIAGAVRAAGAKGLAIGGGLQVTFTGEGEKEKGMNPPKLYSAKYVKPAAAEVPVDRDPEPEEEEEKPAPKARTSTRAKASTAKASTRKATSSEDLPPAAAAALEALMAKSS